MADGRRAWTVSFWECCSPFNLCLKTCCCPCITAGHIHHRMGPQRHNEEAYSTCNGFCAGYAALAACTGCGWVLSMLDRGDLRTRNNLHGSGLADCCGAYWCTCCQLMQTEKELDRLLQEEAQGVLSCQGYQKPEEMIVSPPDPLAEKAHLAEPAVTQ